MTDSMERFDALEQGGDLCGLTCSIGSIVGAAGGLIGGIMGANAADKAAQAQANAGQQAQQTLNSANTTAQQQYQPYTAAGNTALSALAGNIQNGTGFAKQFNLNDFYSDPGYQFTLQQGQNAINSAAAAKGNSLSGGTLKALGAYTSGLANQTYGDAYNRYLQSSNLQYNQLSGVAGMGLNAANGSAQSTLGTAQQVAQAQQGVGNAQAAGIIGKQNAYNSIFGAAGNAAQGFSLNNGLSANPLKLFGQVL